MIQLCPRSDERWSFRVVLLWAPEFHVQCSCKSGILRAIKKRVRLWPDAPAMRRRRFDVGEGFSEDDCGFFSRQAFGDANLATQILGGL